VVRDADGIVGVKMRENEGIVVAKSLGGDAPCQPGVQGVGA
jgi:hypothetical protein